MVFYNVIAEGTFDLYDFLGIFARGWLEQNLSIYITVYKNPSNWLHGARAFLLLLSSLSN